MRPLRLDEGGSPVAAVARYRLTLLPHRLILDHLAERLAQLARC